MAIIAIGAWYLEQYEPIKQVIKRPYDLRLSRNSLLKSGLRADFLNDRAEIETSEWFARYLEGEIVEFYIEGSGSYVISNIDLVSQEIYFSKQEILSSLDPVIFYSPQTEYPEATQAIITSLQEAIENLNERSRIPLSLEIAPRPQEYAIRLSNIQLRKIRKSLLYIADTTPVASVAKENTSSLLLNSNVCVEIGYAIDHKDSGQILLINVERPDLAGKVPFDLSTYKQLTVKTPSELSKGIPKLLKVLLQRFSLLF